MGILQTIGRLFRNAPARNQKPERQPRIVPPGHQEAVEEHLARAGLYIERRNQHIPELAPDQFGADLAAMQGSVRRLDNNSSMLQ